ncbi:MAG: GUN4 domain-containing protein [Calothrix sp. FI2-JRJ7]|jgi:hypothetical protein|nr:GUN4 domain-containing protein [Calothrix sp. FI2-JRJ7]
MQLSGWQLKELQNALIDAFPDIASLERMLLFELDKSLRVIAGEGSLEKIVFELIKTANSQGWVKDLIRAACNENPGNLKLKAIAQELLLQPAPSDDLSSARNVDYTRLRDLLKAQQWREADNETLTVMLKASGRETKGWLNIESIRNFPCTDLRTIDKLWVKYSNGRFGFSVQKQIYLEVGGILDGKYREEAWEKYKNRVGWRIEKRIGWLTNWVMGERLEDYALTFDTTAPGGHLPVIGHLPVYVFPSIGHTWAKAWWWLTWVIEIMDGPHHYISPLVWRLVNCNI